MLSYQHEYHAGNTADIIKHITLTLILKSLCKKEKPFTVIDSHAGAGRFNLEDERLLKTGEAQKGISLLLQKLDSIDINKIPYGIKEYISLEKPYLFKSLYAGSPELERLCMRQNDKLFLIEKHPAAVKSLQTNMQLPLLYDATKENIENLSVTIKDSDSYNELNVLTPPLFKRGLVITDPSYEDEEDYTKTSNALNLVHKKWNTAIIALWYPILTRKQNLLARMLTSLEDNTKLKVNPAEYIKVEFINNKPEHFEDDKAAHMYGSGMFIINPPYQLKEQLEESVVFLNKYLN